MGKIVGLQVKKPKNTGNAANGTQKPQNNGGVVQQAAGGADPNANSTN